MENIAYYLGEVFQSYYDWLDLPGRVTDFT
jgi:hypothetical protein